MFNNRTSPKNRKEAEKIAKREATSKSNENKISFIDRLKARNPSPKEKLFVYSALCITTPLMIIAFGLFLMASSSDIKTKQTLGAMQTSLEQALKPKIDEQHDFLLSQCLSKQVFCFIAETNTPNLELLKFLLNFKEIPNQKYRLFMEVSIPNGAIDKPIQDENSVFKCDGVNTDFYVCQEITAIKPTDVIRVFEKSYAQLPPDRKYLLRFMVKPIETISQSEIDNAVSPKPFVDLGQEQNIANQGQVLAVSEPVVDANQSNQIIQENQVSVFAQ